MKALALLIKTELNRLEMRSLVGWVAEGLILRKTTWTVEVILGAEDGLVNDVGANFGRNRERCLILSQSTLELIIFKLFNGDTSTR